MLFPWVQWQNINNIKVAWRSKKERRKEGKEAETKCTSVSENEASNFIADKYTTHKYHLQCHFKVTKNVNLHNL